MRLALSMLLLAAAAIATLAFAASAHAGGIEVIDEDSFVHCPAVETNGTHHPVGGCLFAVQNEGATTTAFSLHTSTGETVFSQCTITFDVRISETGSGQAYRPMFAGQSCGYTACDEAEDAEDPHAEIPWPFTISEFGPGNPSLNITMCIRVDSVDEGGVIFAPNSPCTVSIPVNDDDGPHMYEFKATAPANRCAQNPTIEVTSHWVVTTTPIEILH